MKKHLMVKRFLRVLVLLLMSSGSVFAQDRCLYVDGFSEILGNDDSEEILLQYAAERKFDCFLLYELSLILGWSGDDPRYTDNSPTLAAFLEKARNAGIDRIAATGDSADFFTEVIDRYNHDQTQASRKFDVYHLELEYWNEVVTFAEYLDQLYQIRALADANPDPIQVETYVGWPTESEALQIDAFVDRVSLHAYRTNPFTTFGYTEDRLQYFTSNNRSTDVSIIFSTEPEFMQPWLEENGMLLGEEVYQEEFDTVSGDWKAWIHLTGFSYFAYSFMANIAFDDPTSIVEPTSNGAVPEPGTFLLVGAGVCAFLIFVQKGLHRRR